MASIVCRFYHVLQLIISSIFVFVFKGLKSDLTCSQSPELPKGEFVCVYVHVVVPVCVFVLGPVCSEEQCVLS